MSKWTSVAGWGFSDVDVGSMRTWKVNLVPFWRTGDREFVVGALDWDGGCADVVGVGSVGWERIVTWGTKEFQVGQVEVSVRAAQTFGEGAVMNVELPMWREAFSTGMFGVAREALLGSERVAIVGWMVNGLIGIEEGRNWLEGRGCQIT